MKKLVLTDFKKVEIVEDAVPRPAFGEAVVRIRYAGICGSDLHVYDGSHPYAKPPMVMGHEACGTVCAIDSDREDIRTGDKVCFHTVEPCGSCEECCSGRENLCSSVKIMGTNMDGVFTQYKLVDAARLIKFNEGVDDQVAALVEPLTVAVHNIRRAGLQPGDHVFISGAGPIGLVIGMMARLSGAAGVVLAEIDQTRIGIAREMGFHVFNPEEENFSAACMEICGGAGFDKAYEITSVQSSFDRCVSLLKRGGVMIQVGMPPAGKMFDLDINKIIYRECDIRGVRHHTMFDMQRAVRIIDSGVLNDQLKKLVSAVYPLEEGAAAFRRAGTDRSVLRVLLDLEERGAGGTGPAAGAR